MKIMVWFWLLCAAHFNPSIQEEIKSIAVEYFENSGNFPSPTKLEIVNQNEVILDKCPKGTERASLTQSELFKKLTDPCRYDKIQRPPNVDANGNSLPVNVYVRSYIFYMQNLDALNLQFTLQMRLQVKYKDPRLAFNRVGSSRVHPIIGEEELKGNLWMPHIFFINEKNSGILGSQSRDVYMTIDPDGTVVSSSRIKVSLYCSMEFRKFPLDRQHCTFVIGSWIYNTSDVKLHWEEESAFTIGTDQILTEFTSVNLDLHESEITSTEVGLQYGDFVGNYSTISSTITFDRTFGYYLLEYYFPSMILVSISWISFWLQADQTPPRAMLGTTSMLTFITLSAAQTRSLPKVNYIKASEVWFIGCALFIFGSLIEFAFVNLLWRRRKYVVLEEITAVNILKKTLTPNMMRKTLNNDSADKKTDADDDQDKNKKTFSFPGINALHYIPVNNMNKKDDEDSDDSCCEVKVTGPSKKHKEEEKKGHHTLTHQQMAILLDKRARLAFPCAFLVFNIFYWTLVNL